MDEETPLSLATLEQITEELGNRSAYGKFIFFNGTDILIGKEYTPHMLLDAADQLGIIAIHEAGG